MISSGGISDLSTIGLDAYAKVTVAAGTPAITKASSNVTSITDRAAGKFRINTTALASANYTITGMAINRTTPVRPTTPAVPKCRSRSSPSVSAT